ncbi:hypothetical protein [Rhizobium leguminosarum]|uniref:Lipoprotein n=1 Tax=Rhizobium leguminosarum TaxID=384 RepID=A0ABD7PZX8_RHILE|nr:hypothetical protein [Rhizobium leguminosarum]TAV73127.1 hypothetical protein ELI28_06235 [Rhizobium leguminosarum]TAV81071.1 hypothetical protein ELI27_06235 [Rhizobium leguminosarum]TAW32411.1 hypothetical protein ELI19_06210 [Rhizobium leguminosarum]TAW42834.1 hypothetical protein ELI18_06150 [Rhizobium leguminosarum]TAZ32800.1 hypothetical protein ELH73_06245 [Rhizobium leguminosarum]
MSNKIGLKRRFFRGLKIGILVVPFLGLAACWSEQVAIPPDAPGVSRSEEYSFGSATQAEDWQATRKVLGQLEGRFGEKSVRILARNLASTTDPQTIKSYYADRLVHQAGWAEMPVSTFADKAWAFAFVSPNGKQVLAVAALDASESAGGIVPLNILTNLDEDKGSKG